ncbi:hypothetical protein COCVIDRAFT_28077 [Bipolaris victoriae FI3]|uniref:Uncharacterized protein n=1 Tax=Bipolaris victoriae (strain FI3) TaxID=930091 RepID=W7EAW5_BIPV3|nr:hypothetical protein COCVIDRAFT_28077 [Bipolaris victoriae FI3]
MLPRNLLPEPIAKTESGQRGAWIVTPGRPSKSSSEIARTLSSRRAGAPSTSHLNEIGPELDNLTLTDSVQLRLRGGADSEDEEYSEKKYAPPSSTLSSLPSIRSTYPSPQEWLQHLLLQGDHATTPFDYSRATRILGLEQGASPGFVSSATLQVPDSSNTRGSGVWSSSETLTNQSPQERMPNYSHLHPSQSRSSAGREDGELRRCPMVIREEPPPVIRVIQPRSSVSQTVKSNFQELLSDNDPGPPYPGDGGHLPAPPPLVDDSRDPDMDLAPRIVMNPSMPTRSNLPVERFLQFRNPNEPMRARQSEENRQPATTPVNHQTTQANNQRRDPGEASKLCDCCGDTAGMWWDCCSLSFEALAGLCVIL